MLPPDLDDDDSLLQGVALWHFLFVQRSQARNTVYIRAGREVLKHPDRWEPWKDERIPAARFVELFRMSLADFNWFSDELRDDLQQDPLGRGEPLTVEAQVAIGLDHLGHDSGYEESQAYIRANRQAYTRPNRWEPWDDDQIPSTRFIELF
ncbi:hypothetical protein PGT21_022666 [Puccinia graminis f. sp. tritici]|uniref:Uncharacterized protein n=1 Tax=Puccinia graminis f. sp. tritici TaxID=56615 RepID=A0A5B0SH24_PUCGR|nr:hypothetical protein PGT21_022666 [Puccinia graminis f. sp. tritici]KAA1137318.1 hypothetical protein PGTUg99_005352 [Puccinia graminis f. sp. tritici]